MPQLVRLHNALEAFRRHDRQVTVILLQVFLTVASHPKFTVNPYKVAKLLGISQASMSHALERLGSGAAKTNGGPRLGGRSLGLIQVKADPEDHRFNVLGLTAAGEDLAQVLSRILDGRSNNGPA